jgi:hypothetical protein
MALQVNASGTIERPRIHDFTLKAPLFGSSDYNAVATGAIDFTERRSWSAAQLQGKLNIESVDLERLRDLPFLQQLLSPAVVTGGTVSLFSRFEGKWDALRIGALLVADKGDLRYRDWLRKPANMPAEVRAKISRHKQQFLLLESELVVGASKTNFSGSVETEPAPRLRLQLHGEQRSLIGWNPLVRHPNFWPRPVARTGVWSSKRVCYPTTITGARAAISSSPMPNSNTRPAAGKLRS